MTMNAIDCYSGEIRTWAGISLGASHYYFKLWSHDGKSYEANRFNSWEEIQSENEKIGPAGMI